MDLSVITPVYNTESYLAEALDSLVALNLQDAEFIVLDDGSTDGSLAIAQEFANRDARFKVLPLEHMGAGSARNVGTQTAIGRYIAFLDSDDFLLKDGFTHALNLLKSSGSDFVNFPFQRLKGEVLKDSNLSRGMESEVTKTTLGANPDVIFGSILCNKIYARDFYFRTVDPIDASSHFEDFMPVLRAFGEARSFDISNQFGFVWRLRTDRGSTSQQVKSETNINARIDALRRCLAYSDEKGDPLRKSYLHKVYYQDVPVLARSGVENTSADTQKKVLDFLKDMRNTTPAPDDETLDIIHAQIEKLEPTKNEHNNSDARVE